MFSLLQYLLHRLLLIFCNYVFAPHFLELLSFTHRILPKVCWLTNSILRYDVAYQLWLLFCLLLASNTLSQLNAVQKTLSNLEMVVAVRAQLLAEAVVVVLRVTHCACHLAARREGATGLGQMLLTLYR